jgi:hypothetical protein
MYTTISKKASLQTYMETFEFHTRLFNNATEGISDADARNRLNTNANHVVWLTGSLVSERYELAHAVGFDLKHTAHKLFANHKGIQPDAVYPAMEDLIQDWATISPLLRDAYGNLSEQQLAAPDPFGMPGGNYTFFETIIFCMDRESYCLGQIGLWRRLLGYPAAKYE